ncbi:MAG: sensor histidine kinase [Acidimicrobiia bacterium]
MKTFLRNASRSLRIRLLVATVALVFFGLLVADVATYRALSSFLIERVDAQLESAHVPLERALSDRRGPRGGDGDAAAFAAVAPGAWVQLRTPDGQPVLSGSTRGDYEQARPQFPAGTFGLPTQGRGATYFTVDADRGPDFRVRAERIDNGNILVLALPLGDVNATLRRLFAIELVVTGVVLLGTVALGLWLVQLGLRPLSRIEATAATIAGSDDLAARVEPDDTTSEVGRLGHALNTMLQRLQHAFARQEASEQRLRQFVGDASHELRTPVAAIGAYAELFDRGADQRPDDLARSMRGIQRETSRIGTLIDDLLLLARLDEGRPLERELVDLGALAEEAAEAARTVGPAWPIVVDAAPEVAVIGDHVALRQIVDNFLANVRTHTPEGTEATLRVTADGDQAVLVVSDVGPGMAPEDAAHVFERFYRADKSRTRASGGSGLGLAVVAALVQSHGGTVEVHSVMGEGTAFTVRLPLAPSQADQSA